MFNILIVDDETDFRNMTTENIEYRLSEVTVTETFSSQAAIKLLENQKKFDLIISDYNMPHGSGGDLLNYIIENNMSVYFILYTFEIAPELPRLQNRFFLGVIEKSNFDQLVNTIERCVSILKQ